MTIRTTLALLAFLLTSINVCGQCRYCNSYEDFLEDKWQPLDTVYCKKHSKGHIIMWGGNDYTLNTGDNATDKTLKNVAFAVKQGNDIYVNCRNLRYEGMRFGKGYPETPGQARSPERSHGHLFSGSTGSVNIYDPGAGYGIHHFSKDIHIDLPEGVFKGFDIGIKDLIQYDL